MEGPGHHSEEPGHQPNLGRGPLDFHRQNGWALGHFILHEIFQIWRLPSSEYSLDCTDSNDITFVEKY